MYCEVTLSQKFPKSMGIFDYKIPVDLQSKIKIGQLVNIPFRNYAREGIIINFKKKATSGINVKEITAILNPNPILTKQQIALAKWMADYYFVSLGTIVKSMIPPIPKTKRELKKVFQTTGDNFDKKTFKTFNKKINKVFYIQDSEKDRFSLISSYCQNNDKQILIIEPTVMDLEKILKQLPKNLNKKIAVITNSLNKTQNYDTWKRIITNEAKIIIGTKLALFSPFQKLDTIIFDQVSNQNHKQSDQNPRYNSEQVIEKISELHKSKLLLINSSLTIHHFKDASDKKLKVIKTNNSTKKITIIDMKQEQLKKNYSIFSDELIINMKDALGKNKKIFLFINKRGSNSSVICRDCGNSLLCDNCSQPLTYHETEQTLYCHQCNKKFELTPFCPNCHGPNFKFIGTGTQKVEQEIIRLFGEHNILRLDKDDQDVSKLNTSKIIIGTELALPYLIWHEISLVGVISADTFLYLPDFNSAERTWQLLKKITNLSEHNVIIQTYNTDNQVIKSFENDDDKFYQNELKNRQDLEYPPFLELIKFIYSDKDKNKCLSETKRIYKLIQTISNKSSIITPLYPFLQGKWRMYIIVKFDPSKDSDKINNIIKKIPDNWIIDRNPFNLL